MLDLHRLRYFVAIMDCGSISGASTSLNTAQPALSYHMNELERLTGLKLFDRHPRGMSPTSDGLFLLEHARSVLQAVEHVEREISTRSHRSFQASVSLGMIPSLATIYAREIIAAWSQVFLKAHCVSLRLERPTATECFRNPNSISRFMSAPGKKTLPTSCSPRDFISSRRSLSRKPWATRYHFGPFPR